MMLGGMGVCNHHYPSFLLLLFMVGRIGYQRILAAARWQHGDFSYGFYARNERIKSCADVLIYSNLLMIAINVVAINHSPFIGLILAILCLVIGIVFIWMLPLKQENEQSKTFQDQTHGSIKNPLILLCLFIFIITINSGLMYQVINPAFGHLTDLRAGIGPCLIS